jgi:hypothetical protein
VLALKKMSIIFFKDNSEIKSWFIIAASILIVCGKVGQTPKAWNPTYCSGGTGIPGTNKRAHAFGVSTVHLSSRPNFEITSFPERVLSANASNILESIAKIINLSCQHQFVSP